jgi:hypothetical protein
MYSLGSVVGGLLAIYALSMVWEWALFKRINDDPVTGKLSAVGAAWLSAGTLAGFGMANGGPFLWFAFLVYLIPALLVGFLFHRRGLQLREEAADDTDYAETFR